MVSRLGELTLYEPIAILITPLVFKNGLVLTSGFYSELTLFPRGAEEIPVSGRSLWDGCEGMLWYSGREPLNSVSFQCCCCS